MIWQGQHTSFAEDSIGEKLSDMDKHVLEDT
jgi:hypothetical protein